LLFVCNKDKRDCSDLQMSITSENTNVDDWKEISWNVLIILTYFISNFSCDKTGKTLYDNSDDGISIDSNYNHYFFIADMDYGFIVDQTTYSVWKLTCDVDVSGIQNVDSGVIPPNSHVNTTPVYMDNFTANYSPVS
jgi:hypothetical protein